MVSGWLGKHVEMFYGPTPDKPFGVGQVKAYSDSPMVYVEPKSGENVWWSASLVREVPCDCLCHRDEEHA